MYDIDATENTHPAKEYQLDTINQALFGNGNSEFVLTDEERDEMSDDQLSLADDSQDIERQAHIGLQHEPLVEAFSKTDTKNSKTLIKLITNKAPKTMLAKEINSDLLFSSSED